MEREDVVTFMQWDYIIVGAGSAGCALAYELARAGEHKVLVLESGAADSSIFIQIPAAQIQAVKRHDWGYVSQPDPSRNGQSEGWTRGHVLGGSSSVNGMMYVRGAASDFDRWEAMGNKGWSYADVLPLFRDLECSDQTHPSRGRSGPLFVQTVRKAHPLTDAFVRSAVASGIPFNADYNAASQEGVSYAQLSQKNGFRYSAARAFLKPLLKRKNFKLLLGALVQKIDIQDGRATAVSFTRGGVAQTATARHIIVCAGAINSPKLLMLSGIGDPQELGKHGIDVKVNSPHVGLNLREHPLLKMRYRMKVPSNNLTEGLGQKLRIGLQFLLGRRGPIAYLFEAAAFLRTSAQLPSPDIQLHYLAIGYDKNDKGATVLSNYPAVTVLLNKSHPESRGRIRLASADPAAAPLIECRLYEREADIETMVRGVSEVRKIMAALPIADLVEREEAPGLDANDGAALKSYLRENTGIAFHPAGTCRMGVDAHAVVTPQLRVNGVENLWVADASIMPDLISGNTNAVCTMIGIKLGRELAGK